MTIKFITLNFLSGLPAESEPCSRYRAVPPSNNVRPGPTNPGWPGVAPDGYNEAQTLQLACDN